VGLAGELIADDQGVTYALESHYLWRRGDFATTRWPGVPAMCPIGGAIADNHGLSRSAGE
jgi:hypothetical protein